MILDTRTIDSPVGLLLLLAHGDALVACEFTNAPERVGAALERLAKHLGPCETREHADPAGAVSCLARYFGGERTAMDEQKVELHGTAFQLEVWGALRQIPAGSTWTYAQLATHIGRPLAQRAVGAANGANPIGLFVPCHRVIAADRTLWGYGGGLERKRWLLVHEGATFADRHAQVAMELGGEGKG